jgi:hypothetical protein
MVKISWQISAPLPLRELYRMIPLSAKLISLDSPFEASLTKLQQWSKYFLPRLRTLKLPFSQHRDSQAFIVSLLAITTAFLYLQL